MKEIQRQAAVEALRASHGHIGNAARELEVSRLTLGRWARNWEIDPAEYGGCVFASEARREKGVEHRRELARQAELRLAEL